MLQHHQPGREESHERRRALLARDGAESLGDDRRQQHRAGGAAVARPRRAPPVGRQREERRRTFEALAPPGELARERLAAQVAPLPGGEVGVLERQRRERRVRGGLAGGRDPVEQAELAHEDPRRPGVACDVVNGERRDVVARGEPQQPGAQQRAAGEVERQAGLRGEPAGELGVPHAGGECREVDERQRRGGQREDLLQRLAAPRGEDRAQRLVAGDEAGERRGERCGVELAAQANGVGDVEHRRAGAELLEEPEALLREGERQRAIARHPREGRRGGGGRAAEHSLDLPRQAGDGRRVEQLVHPQLDAERLARPRDHLRGGQRVAAEVEEVLVDPHPLAPEHCGEQPGEDLLGRRARAGERRPLVPRQRRQRADVELAACGTRQGGERHDGARHQGGGQPTGEETAQLVGQSGPRSSGCADGARDDVADQRLLPPHLAGRHHRLRHRRVLEQPCLDLPELDAHAADLHLAVGAAEVLELPLCVPAREVAGTVGAIARAAGLGRERVRHEALGGQVGASGVAAREAGAGEQQLAGRASRHRRERRAHHVDREVRDRPAERHRGACEPRLAAVGRRVGRRLGRPVQVDDLSPREPLLAAPHQIRGERLAAAADTAQRPAVGDRRLGEERAQHRGDELQHGDPLARHAPRQRVGLLVLPRARQHQQRAGAERRKDLPERSVEGDRRLLQQAVLRAERVLGESPEDAVRDRAVRDRHPLRPPGRAGGEQHVGGVVGVGLLRAPGRRGLQLPPGRLGQRRLKPEDRERRQHRAHPGRRARLLRQHEPRAARLQHVGDALGRVLGVDRHETAASLEDAEQAGDQRQGPLGEEGDRHLRSDPGAAQPARHPRGHRGELSVAPGDAVAAHGRPLRRRRRPGGEPAMEPLLGAEVNRGRIALDEQLRALLGGEHRQLGKRRLRPHRRRAH